MLSSCAPSPFVRREPLPARFCPKTSPSALPYQCIRLPNLVVADIALPRVVFLLQFLTSLSNHTSYRPGREFREKVLLQALSAPLCLRFIPDRDEVERVHTSRIRWFNAFHYTASVDLCFSPFIFGTIGRDCTRPSSSWREGCSLHSSPRRGNALSGNATC